MSYIIPPWKRTDYFFIIDEFKQFINTSEDAADVFLSEARKFKVWLILAHQYLGQLTPELVAALQNIQRLVLKLEDDAISMAQKIGKYQPDAEIGQMTPVHCKRFSGWFPTSIGGGKRTSGPSTESNLYQARAARLK